MSTEKLKWSHGQYLKSVTIYSPVYSFFHTETVDNLKSLKHCGIVVPRVNLLKTGSAMEVNRFRLAPQWKAGLHRHYIYHAVATMTGSLKVSGISRTLL